MDNLDNIKVKVIDKNEVTIISSQQMIGFPTLVGPAGTAGPQGPAGPSGGVWGEIEGTLSDQTDLQDALDAKANSADLGTMAEVNDVPSSNNIIYGRRNADWYDLDDRYYTKSEIDTQLSGKQNTLSWDTAPTSGGTNPMKSGAIYNYKPFKVRGNASAGSSATFTDSRIDSDHWQVKENGIYFGTPSNVTSAIHWVTNNTNHTITLQATFTGATTVVIDMEWFQ